MTTTTTEEVQAPAVDLTPINERMNQLEARMRQPNLTTMEKLSVIQALSRQIETTDKTTGTEKVSLKVRALADVLSSGNAGVLPPSWTNEVRSFIDSMRYMFAAAGSIAFPTSGHTLTVPKITTNTLVGPRGAEKSELPSRALVTGTDVYTAKYFAGAVDVAYELIWQSEPAVWEIIVSNILAMYAQVTDAALTLDVETVATPTGAVLPFTDWKTFIGAVLPVAESIRAATGVMGNRLSLTASSWGKLMGLTDTTGRRILAPGGPTNSDGTAALLERSVDLGGIYAFHNPRAAEDCIFNEVSVRVAERAPTSLIADNVALGGKDLGVIGGYLLVPWPVGIKVFSVTLREGETASGAKK